MLGRSKAYESIIKGEEIKAVNVPESFNVLVREMKGLCLDAELLKRSESGEYVSAVEAAKAEEEKRAKEENAAFENDQPKKKK